MAPVGDGKIVIIAPRGGVAVLTMLAVGELRAALRDAALAPADPKQDLDRRYEIELHRTSA